MLGVPLVVVMGVSGVGKSTVGARLAARLGVGYVDGDDLHPEENVEAMRQGRPLTEEQRRPWLLAVAAWLAGHDEAGGVVSCSALRRAHRDRLTAAAPRVTYLFLTGPPALVRERIAGREHFMPESLLDSQLATVEPPTSDERHVTLDVAATPDQLVEAFLRSCRPDVTRGRRL